MSQRNTIQTKVDHLFSKMGRVRVRKMFGGAGVYSGQDMFALLDDERVYVKADDKLKEDLQAKGGEPFAWTNPNTGKTIEMSYVSLPVNALSDRDEVTEWARAALNVAIEARCAKVKSPRRKAF